jgi:hypothetical protein
MYDRAYGSTSLIVQVDGTTAPRCPNFSEYLKAHVYLPPAFVSEVPQAHLPIATIVQLFIEHVGIPTVSRWKESATKLGWPLSQEGPRFYSSRATLPLIPPPTSPSSSYYIFPGRVAGSLSMTEPPASSLASQQRMYSVYLFFEKVLSLIESTFTLLLTTQGKRSHRAVLC